MKTYVIGAGAVGSFIAAEMHRNNQNVTLVDSGPRIAQIQRRGIMLRQDGEDVCIPVPVTDRMREEADWIIVAVPTPDVYDAYCQNADFLESGRVLTVQGTVHADTLLCAHFDRELMYSSIFDHLVDMEPDGAVRVIQTGGWYLGKPYFVPDPHLHALAACLPASLLPSIVMDVKMRQWSWVVYQMAQTLPALMGLSYKECYADGAVVAITLQCMHEALTVMAEAGVVWRSWDARLQPHWDSLVSGQRRETDMFFQSMWTGWACDAAMGRHLRRGVPTEIEYINGEVMHLAQHFGLESPLNRRCVEMIHELEKGMRGAYSRDEVVGVLHSTASSPTRV